MNNSQGSDLSRLIFFLNKSKALIRQILDNRYEFILKEFATDDSFWAILDKAWNEVRENIEHVRQKLQSKPLDFVAKLKKHGLTGVQLEFKMNLFDMLLSRFNLTRSIISLRRLLNLINSIFGSLTSVFPALEAVTEFKDALEQIIKRRKNIVDKTSTKRMSQGLRHIRFRSRFTNGSR